MLQDDLYVAGVGTWFPKQMPVDEAIAAGSYDAEVARRTGMVRVAIAGDDDPAPTMAIRAGRQALSRSGHRADDVGLLLHAVANHSGLDAWNAASYLQHRILAGHGMSFEIHQLSNGAAGAIELASAFLHHRQDSPAALITTADQFAPPVWDRWTASPGLVFGDGASAIVLSRLGGFARVRSVVSASAPELEGMQRGHLPFRPYSDPTQHPISIRDRTVEFSDTMSLDEAAARMGAGLHRAADQACVEAGLRIDDADHVVLPNFGRELLHHECLEPLGVDIDKTTWRYGVQFGHVGAADQFAGLAHLAEDHRLAAGQRVLLVGVGGGFNWTCVVLEIQQAPNWPDPIESDAR